MKTLAMVLAAVALITTGTVGTGIRTASACGAAGAATKAATAKPRPAKVMTASFKVDGMHCEGCADKVTAALGAKDGIVSVKVALGDKRVTVEYDPTKLDTTKIAKMISDAGYAASAEA